jgi:hypothetical protein
MSQRFGVGIRRAGGMTKRQTVLSLMRLAGYDGDNAYFTRLLIENPISRRVAEEAWREGVRARAAGVPRSDPKRRPAMSARRYRRGDPGRQASRHMRKWNVMLGHKVIDAVFQQVSPGSTIARTADDIRRGLVDHDGYDSRIVVRLSPASERRHRGQQQLIEGYRSHLDREIARKRSTDPRRRRFRPSQGRGIERELFGISHLDPRRKKRSRKGRKRSRR